MWLPSWLRTWKRHGAPRPRPTFRPRLEALEGRVMPSTLTVTSNLDAGAGSLRAVIAAANANDTIVFGPSLAGNILLTSGELVISKSLTIQGVAPLAIAAKNSRIFEVDGAQTNVTLSGLVMREGDGYASASSHGANPNDGDGGAVLNFGALTLSGCSVVLSTAVAGCGVYNAGTLTVSGCTVSSDSALSSSGGGIFNLGTATLINSTLSNDTAGEGGGILNAGTLTLTGCTLSGDSTSAWGGGIANLNTLTISGCTLSGDSAVAGGGGIFNDGTATVSDCTLSGDSHGGGIYNYNTDAKLTVSDSIFSNNNGADIYGQYTDGGGNTVSGSGKTQGKHG